MPATGALIGTPASISDRLDAHTERHRRRAVRAQHLGRRGAACRRTPPGSARPAAPPGRRARRGRSRGASANRRGRSRRWPTAACCSGAGSASCVSGVSVSSSWFMRGMASVQHVQHLGLAALEQAGAVRRRQHADLGRHRAQVGEATAVDAHALVDDALADELLGQRADGLLDLLLAAGELARRLGGAAQLGDGRVADGVGGGVALGLGGDRDRPWRARRWRRARRRRTRRRRSRRPA